MTGLSDIPDGPHWAIITTTSITIPGDERSRTNPGHGYPESRETFIVYEAFTAQAEWGARAEYLTLKGHTPFRAIKVEVADVSVSVKTKTR